MKRYIVFSVMVFMLVGLVLAVGPTLAQEEDESDPSSPDATPVGGVSPQAALGTDFTYQGRLESGGSPVDGTCDLQFSLYDAASDGTQVGTTQTATNVSVSNGLFTVELDFGAGAFSGDARWLEIAVRCPAGSGSYTTLGLQALTAAPYALYALAAPWSGLTGVPAGLDDGDDVGWSLTGNADTTPGTNFLGTTYNKDLELHVGGSRALLLGYNATSPNLIGGYSGNWVTAGVYGATIGGGGASGKINRVTANYATVGGGGQNTASGQYATVPGGRDNVAQSYDSFAAGRRARAYHSGAFVWGDSTNADIASNGNDQFIVRASGGVTLTSSAAAGGIMMRLEPHPISPNLVGGHSGNWLTAGVRGATIGGGGASGNTNRVTDHHGTVGGGRNNQAGDDDATLDDEVYATVGGGWSNEASGYAATVPGGAFNTAQGNYSFAAGHQARALHNGAFVWGDTTVGYIDSNGINQFIVRAGGGITLYSSSSLSDWVIIYDDGTDIISTSVGARLTVGGVWTNVSDHNLKENFTSVDGQEVLARLAEMPISTWNYKAESPSVRRMGPTAQDFYAAFGLGDSDTSISTIDAEGVALAAIQALYELSQEQAARIEQLEAQVAALEVIQRGGGR